MKRNLDRKVVALLVVIGLGLIALATVKGTEVVYDALEGGYAVKLPFCAYFIMGVICVAIYKLQIYCENKRIAREKAIQKKAAREKAARDKARFEALSNLY